MADRILRIVIRAENEADKVFADVSRSLNRLGLDFDIVNKRALEGAAGFTRFQASLVTLNQTLELARRVYEALKRPIEELIQRAERFGRLSAQFGIAVPELEKLDYAAGQASVSLEGILVSGRTLGKQMVEAANGTKQARDAFARLGLSQKELDEVSKRGLIASLDLIVQRLAKMPNQLERAAVGTQLLGRNFGEVTAAAAKGGGSLQALADRAEHLGAVLGAQLNEELDRVGGKAKDVHVAFLAFYATVLQNTGSLDGLIAGLDAIAEGFVALRKNEELQAIFRDMASGASDAAKSLIDIVEQVARLVAAFLQLKTGLEPLELLNLAVQGLATTVTAAAASVDTLALAWAHWTNNEEGARAAAARLHDDTKRLNDIVLRSQQGVQRLTGEYKGFVGPLEEVKVKAPPAAEGIAGMGKNADKAARQLASLRAQTKGLAEELEVQLVHLDALQHLPIGTTPEQLRAITQEQERGLAIAKNRAEAEKAIAVAQQEFGVAGSRAIVEQIRHLEDLKDATYDATKAANDAKQAWEFFTQTSRDDTIELEHLTGQLTDRTYELAKAKDAANKAHVTDPEQLRQLDELTGKLFDARKAAQGYTSIFDTAAGIGSDFFDSVIIGGRKFSEFAKTVPASIGKMFEEGFIKGLKAKTDFDEKFQVNIFDLVKNAGEVLTGQRGIGDIFTGAFKGAGAATEAGVGKAADALAVLPSAAENAAQMSSESLHGIATASETSAQQASSAWGGFFNFLLQLAQNVIGQVISLFGGLIDLITGLFSGGEGTSGGGVFGTIASGAKAVFGEDGVISKAFSYVSDLVGGAGFLGWIGTAAKSVFGEGGVIGDFFSTVKSYFTGGSIGHVFSTLTSLAGVIGGGFAAFQGVMTLFDQKASALKKAFGGGEALLGIATAFRSLQTLIPQFAHFVQSVVSSSIVGAGNIAPLSLGSSGTIGITEFARALFSSSGLKEAIGGIGKPIAFVIDALRTALVNAIEHIAPSLAGAVLGTVGGEAAGGALGVVAQQAAQMAADQIASQIGAVLGPVLAVAGALYSIAQGAKGIVDNLAAYSKATLGDTKAVTNLAALQATILAAFTAGGAVAGSFVPILGTAIGAAVGAAIGSAVGSAINSAITGALTGAVSERSLRHGIPTREGLLKIVLDDTAIKIIRGFGTLGVTAFGDSTATQVIGGILNPIGALLDKFLFGAIPDPEVILDKLFVRAIQPATGRLFNRQLGQYLGQDVGPRRRAEVLPAFRMGGELRADTYGAATLVGSMVGAGTDEFERLQRLFRILANNFAQGKKSIAEIHGEIFKIVRTVTGSLLNGMVVVNNLFEGGADRAKRTRKEVDLVARSYAAILPGIDVRALVAANQRETGGVKIKGFRQDLRVEVLEAAVAGSLDLTKKLAGRVGDGLIYVARQLQDKVPAGINALALALDVARERVPHAIKVFLDRLADAVTADKLKTAGVSEADAQAVTNRVGKEGRVFTGLILLAISLQEKLPAAIDAFALALAIAADGAKKSFAALSHELSRAIQIQTSLYARGLPPLSPEEAAALAEPGGGKRGLRTAQARAGALATLNQWGSQSTLSALGFGGLGAGLKANRELEAATFRLQQTFTDLDKREKNLQAAIKSGDAEQARRARQKIKDDQGAIEQITQQAIQAAEAWGQAVLGIIDQLRTLQTTMEDFNLSTGETIDSLTGAADTAARYSNVIDLTTARLDKAASAGAKLDIINRIMDLLQRQAQAAIQDVQDAADAQKKPLQERLDAIAEELDTVQALASLLDGVRSQMAALRIDAAGGGVSSLRQTQVEIARQLQVFRGGGTPEERAAAAQQVASLAGTAVEIARQTFGPASQEFRTVQQEQLGNLSEIEQVAKAAADKQASLLEEQKDLQQQIKDIDTQAAKDIETIKETLATQLLFWQTQAAPLFGQQAQELRSQLAELFPGQDIEALLADPQRAQLAVQQAQLKKLEEIRLALLGQSAATPPTTTTGTLPPGPSINRPPIGIGGTPISFFAQGGIVRRPTLAVVGETGPEAIIPLRSRHPDIGSSAPINVTVVMQPAKGEPMARAQLWGRTAASAIEAELQRSNAFGAGGRTTRRKVG